MKNQVKENIGLIVALVATLCSIFMFWLGWDMGEKSYQIKDDTIYSHEDLTGSFQVGYKTGLSDAEESAMASHVEIVEAWMSNLESVTINDDTIHIIDSNGEEWVLLSDSYK